MYNSLVHVVRHSSHIRIQWNFWIQLIIGGAVQFAHFWTPETRSSILVTREAKRRRQEGETLLYSTKELEGSVLSVKFVLTTWARPFIMFATEPIVLCLSLLSGFSDALVRSICISA